MGAALATKINGLAPRCGQLRVKGKQFGKPVNDGAEEQPRPGMAGAAAVCRSPSLEKPCSFEPGGMGAQPCLGERKDLRQLGGSCINKRLPVLCCPVSRSGHGGKPGPGMGRCPANTKMRRDPLHQVNKGIALPSGRKGRVERQGAPGLGPCCESACHLLLGNWEHGSRRQNAFVRTDAFSILIFGRDSITIAPNSKSNTGRQTCVIEPPLVRTPRGGFLFSSDRLYELFFPSFRFGLPNGWFRHQ